ncbi:MAG: SWIM zinc finger family protein [Sulfolobales archaeon]
MLYVEPNFSIAPILVGARNGWAIRVPFRGHERVPKTYREAFAKIGEVFSKISCLPSHERAKPIQPREVRLEEGVLVWVVESFTDPDKTYEVRYEQGHFKCTCPDFTKRGGVCKHIASLRAGMLKSLENSDNIQEEVRILPPPEWADPMEWVLSPPHTPQVLYTPQRENLVGKYFGIELEIPKALSAVARLRLNKHFRVLLRQGLLKAFETDASVRGGEIKTPPLTEAQFLRAVKHFALLRKDKGISYAFVSQRLAGLHVHINVGDLGEEAKRRAYEFGLLAQKEVDLPKIFGRDYNQYAEMLPSSYVRATLKRYYWLNIQNSQTIEVRLGSATQGDFFKIARFCQILAEVVRDGKPLAKGLEEVKALALS